MTSSKVELLKTLQHLKRSVSKIQNESPSPDGQGVTDSNTDSSFNKEFRACLKELKVQRTEEAKKECNSLKKRKYFIERSVDIIDKISIDDVLRQYKHDYGNFFQNYENNQSDRHHIKKAMLKILERKRNMDGEQKDAMKELCKQPREISNMFCELCDLGPMSQGQLNNHNMQNHEEFKKLCCDTEFNSYKLWNLHNKEKHNTYKCEEFSDSWSRFKHKRKAHTTKTEFTCTFCGKKWKDTGNFKRHIKQVHTDMKPYKCQTCERTFSDKGNLNRHIKSKHEKVRDKCPHCSQTCSFGTLQRHIRTEHKKEIFQCPKCDKDFRSKYGLSSHINEKHKMVPKEYKCQICGKGDLFSPQARVTHKIKEHGKQYSEKKRENKAPQYDCSFCPEHFDQKIMRKRHEIDVHNGGKSDRVVCECGVTALTEKRLEFHKKISCRIKIVNEKLVKGFEEKQLERLGRPDKVKNYKCDQDKCGKAFSDPNYLKTHIKERHQGVRIKCTLCDNEYFPSYLAAHVLREHKKAKKDCEFCFKSIFVYDIKEHMRNKHNL